jgi:hypothetical protein
MHGGGHTRYAFSPIARVVVLKRRLKLRVNIQVRDSDCGTFLIDDSRINGQFNGPSNRRNYYET